MKIKPIEAFHLYGSWFKKILTINVIFLLVMSLFRFAALFHYGEASLFQHPDLKAALFLGLRFDLSVICYINAIPLLILSALSLTHDEDWIQSFATWSPFYYTFFFSIVGLILAVDLGYYSYFQDHLNILIFAMIEDDTKALLKTFWRNYPVIRYFLTVLFCLFLLWKTNKAVLSPPRFRQHFIEFPLWGLPLVIFSVLAFCIMGARGSFGLFPLGQADTAISESSFMNYLSYNGVHSLHRAVKLKMHDEMKWNANWREYGYGDIREAFADYFEIPQEQVPQDPLDLLKHQSEENPWAVQTKPHVIVLVMESFGAHWLHYQSPEFNLLGDLEKHFKEDYLYKNFMPSTSSTIGSLSALMISSPHRPLTSFLTESNYVQVSFRSSPAQVYNQAGYETRYIYAGNPGWRDVNKFALRQGFQTVEGESEISKELGGLKETHDWGVYDEDVYQYISKKLEKAQKPQMMLIMTTGNHPPYQLPKGFSAPKQTMPKELSSRLIVDKDLAEQRFRSFYYSTQKLGEFLTRLKASPLGQKTIVAVTGDHGFHLINFSEAEQLKKWSVPLYFYIPKALHKNYDPKTFASHIDIFPTLYNLSLSKAFYHSVGQNIFAANYPNMSFHFSRFGLSPAGTVYAINNKITHYFSWKSGVDGDFDQMIPSEPTPELERLARRYRGLMSLCDYYFYQEYKGK